MRMTIDTSTTLPRLSPEARRHLRGRITNHANWDTARQHAGLEKASDIRKEHYEVLAQYLGIDLAPYHSDAWHDLPGAREIIDVVDAEPEPELEPEPVNATPASDTAPSLPDVLARIEPVLNDKVAGDLRRAIDTAVATARAEAERNAGQVAAAQAAVLSGGITLPTAPAGQETLGSLFKVRNWAKNEKVSMWNRPDAPVLDPHYIFDSQALAWLVPELEKGALSWFWGYAGTGKSTFWENVAAKTGRGYTLLALSEESEFPPLVGTWIIDPATGGMVYKKGPLALAMERPGEIIHIDEISKAMSVVDALQTVLSSNTLALDTGEVVKLAPGSCFVITDNTSGSGDETGLHSHAKEQCKALIDRAGVMLQARFMPADVECRVIAGRLGLANPDLVRPFVDLANKTREETADTDEPIGHRALLAWVRSCHRGAPISEAFDLCVVAKMRPAYREHARQAYRAHFDTTAAQAIAS